MDRTAVFVQQRPRLVRIATRLLSDSSEAEDVAQETWLRLSRQVEDPENVPAWLTTVTTRLCLDRLRARTPVPTADVEPVQHVLDVLDEVLLADTVGVALQAVLDRLSPPERVAFVLHDSFGVEFTAIAAALGTTPAAARKLASRARAKVRRPAAEHGPADWQVVDAFMAAARRGEFDRLMELLAPDVEVSADAAALQAGTPERISGRQDVASFFNGSAKAALSAYLGDRPAAAWYHLGQAKVVFDFTVRDGEIAHIRFRADPSALASVTRREQALRQG